MSSTTFGVNDALAQKLWEKRMIMAERNDLEISSLMGDEESVIQVKSQLSKSAGDQVTFALQALLSGAGFTSGQQAQGNGEALSMFSDAIKINELGHTVGVAGEGTIDAQRVSFDLRERAKAGLTRWWATSRSKTFFNQVCGFTPANSGQARFTGLNPITGPTALRRMWAGTATADEGLGGTDVFTLNLIDKAVELARTGDDNQIIPPLRIGGVDKYVMYLHDKQVTSLRTSTATSGWTDIQKSALAGGAGSKSPIYTGALGEYNGVILRKSTDVTQGVNSTTGAAVTTVRRAVLLGAQAAVCAYGKQGTAGLKFRWSEMLFDHDRSLEVGAWNIWGLKKTVFNSQDYGTLVVSTTVV